ncbi:MAG: GNAT family N-acetyltransferase, partial [Pseudomonadota bacterium]
DLGEGLAHLRWFIVNPSHHSLGLGKQLLARAVEFVDERRFAETHLWTLKGLDAARRLYERTGFVLAEEYEGEQWGTRITEQRWVRKSDLSL